MNIKKKIFLGNLHIAYVNSLLLSDFCQTMGVVNYSAWVREQAFSSFGIMLHNKDDLLKLQDRLEAAYYDNAGEWLQDIMRTTLRKERKI